MEEIAGIALRLCEAIGTERTAIAALLDEQVQAHNLGSEGLPVLGRSEAALMLEQFAKVLGISQCVPVDLAHEDDRVVCRWTAARTSGRPLTGLTFVRVGGGKVIELWMYSGNRWI